MNPKEDWLIFEDTHEAIVDRETWELAQKLRKTPKRIDTLGEANPLTGLLYCADCGEKKLSEQEEKYSAELDEALKQYAELKEQAAGMDAVELMDARLAVREEQERSVASRVKSAYGEKYDPMMMQDSKRDVANLLNEETEARSIRERLRQKQQAQQKQNKKKSRDRWER